MPFFLIQLFSCATLVRVDIQDLIFSHWTWLMKFVSTIVGLIVFILFFGFALKNTQEVNLHLFLDYELRGPLVLMLLGAFVAGACSCVLALMPTLLRHRRETNKQKATIRALQATASLSVPLSQPDNVGARQ
jgi:putative membrane protein